MSKKKILIVEDNTKLIKFLSNKMDKAGFEFSVAHDGQEGLEKIQSDQPDLVLLDLVMPVMDGLTMLKKMRAKSDVPVIVLTNLSDEATIKEAVKLGGNDYLVKVDHSLDEVVKKINQALK